jgi:hypothetical protein
MRRRCLKVRAPHLLIVGRPHTHQRRPLNVPRSNCPVKSLRLPTAAARKILSPQATPMKGPPRRQQRRLSGQDCIEVSKPLPHSTGPKHLTSATKVAVGHPRRLQRHRARRCCAACLHHVSVSKLNRRLLSRHDNRSTTVLLTRRLLLLVSSSTTG